MAGKYSLNIFDFLKQLDKQNYQAYKDLSFEDKKQVAPLVLMRWMSNTWDEKLHRYYVQVVNEIVNKNFWDLSLYKDLQMRLLCLTGLGKSVGHRWVKSAQIGKSEDKMHNIIKEYYDCSDEEVEIIEQDLTDDDKIDMLFNLGYDKKDIKKILG